MSSPADYYDRKAAEAAELRKEIEREQAKPEPDEALIRFLKQRLEVARYVGD